MSHCLILSRSARALTESANKAGFHVHAIDAFADEDTQTAAVSCYQCAYSEYGFEPKQLKKLTTELVTRFPITFLVLGAGMESTSSIGKLFSDELLRYCNSASTLTMLIDPVRFSAVLKKSDIPHPAVFADPSVVQGRFLKKRIGSMGGEFVSWASANSNAGELVYFQQFVEGEVHSVVFLADGKRCVIVGFNKQWQCSEYEDTPFLYKGACSIKPEKSHVEKISNILQAIVAETGLKGLCGMDYILNQAGEMMVLEVNPRPPSSFELHEGSISLVQAHKQCFNAPIQGYQRCHAEKACVIIYATKKIKVKSDFDWPSWAKDRPAQGTIIQSRQPVCTVHAEAETAAELTSILDSRKQRLESQLLSFEIAV